MHFSMRKSQLNVCKKLSLVTRTSLGRIAGYFWMNKHKNKKIKQTVGIFMSDLKCVRRWYFIESARPKAKRWQLLTASDEIYIFRNVFYDPSMVVERVIRHNIVYFMKGLVCLKALNETTAYFFFECLSIIMHFSAFFIE